MPILTRAQITDAAVARGITVQISVQRGTGRITVDNHWFAVGPGSIVLVKPGEHYQIINDGTDATLEYVINAITV
jgi:quercetin dioxygenase-like cupin family protein